MKKLNINNTPIDIIPDTYESLKKLYANYTNIIQIPDTIKYLSVLELNKNSDNTKIIRLPKYGNNIENLNINNNYIDIIPI